MAENPGEALSKMIKLINELFDQLNQLLPREIKPKDNLPTEEEVFTLLPVGGTKFKSKEEEKKFEEHFGQIDDNSRDKVKESIAYKLQRLKEKGLVLQCSDLFANPPNKQLWVPNWLVVTYLIENLGELLAEIKPRRSISESKNLGEILLKFMRIRKGNTENLMQEAIRKINQRFDEEFTLQDLLWVWVERKRVADGGELLLKMIFQCPSIIKGACPNPINQGLCIRQAMWKNTLLGALEELKNSGLLPILPTIGDLKPLSPEIARDLLNGLKGNDMVKEANGTITDKVCGLGGP